MTKLTLKFANGYCKEALGENVYLSEEFLTDDIIHALFESKDNLSAIYDEGKQLLTKFEMYYDLDAKSWLSGSTDNTFSIRYMGILLEDWEFVNKFNDRGVKT